MHLRFSVQQTIIKEPMEIGNGTFVFCCADIIDESHLMDLSQVWCICLQEIKILVQCLRRDIARSSFYMQYCT